MVSLLALLAGCGSSRSSAPAPLGPPAPDVAVDAAVSPRAAASPLPTLRLPDGLRARAYRAELTVDPARPRFGGAIELDATLAAPASNVWLNADGLQVITAEARVGGDVIALEAGTARDGFLELRAARDLPAGELTIRVVYDGAFHVDDSRGAFVQDEGGHRYVITQFEPIDARDVFPCIDEPDSKVPWQLTLTVPAGQTAISNTPVRSSTEVGDGTTRVEFAATRPLPSYLIAFAVGPFEWVDAGTSRGGTPVRIAALAGRAADAAYAARSATRILDLLEDYFGIPYPYPKLDLVPIPSTTWFGAMENAGMITAVADLVLFAPDALRSETIEFDGVMAHEMAHQWFGDHVTMRWWDDIWLNEAFATWMEDKVMVHLADWEPDQPLAHLAGGLRADSVASARQIRQPVSDAFDLQNIFDGITYQKGAAVIAMFEQWVGPAAFQAGVRAYLTKYAVRNASAREFLAEVDGATPLDLTTPFSTFLDQAGAPLVTATVTCAGGAARVELTQSRWLPPGATPPSGDPPRWQLPVCLAYGDDRGRRPEQCVFLTETTQAFALDGPGCPTWLYANSGGKGYHRTHVDVAALTKRWRLLSTSEQRQIVSDVEAMVTRDEAPYGALLTLTTRVGGSRFLDRAATRAIGDAMDVVSPGRKAALRAWVRTRYGAQARKVGWVPDRADTLATLARRDAVVGAAAFLGRDPGMLGAARKLAPGWRRLPRHVRGEVLAAATLVDPSFARDLLATLPTITDRSERRQVLSALAQTEDRAMAATLLDRMLAPGTDLVQEWWLANALAHEPFEDQVDQFVRAHVDELAPRMPEYERTSLAWPVVRCEPEKRDDAAAWITAHIGPMPGADRLVAQAIERMDVCIARQAKLRPQVDAWVDSLGRRR